MIVKKATAFTLMIVTVLTLSACGIAAQQNADPDDATPEALSGNPLAESALVAYFSRTGNTEDLARILQEHTGGNVDNARVDVETWIAGLPLPEPNPAPNGNAGVENTMITISITVAGSVFSAKLYSNDTARALLEQFPMTLDMSELNGNEKFCYVPEKLPTASEEIGNIRAGDLMLYGSDCLVLFYESFSTPYSYTRLGRVEDSSGLASALERGNVRVSFAVND